MVTPLTVNLIARFISEGLLSPTKYKAVRSEVEELCVELKASAGDLVNSFGFPEELVTIATDWQQ